MVLFREIREFFEFADADVDTFCVRRDSGIAGGAVDLFHLRTLFQLPDQRMFAPARTDHQNFHFFSIPGSIPGNLPGALAIRLF